jgi:hypothetical protein
VSLRLRRETSSPEMAAFERLEAMTVENYWRSIARLFLPKATMNDKYKEIGASLAIIGSIVYAFHLFMDWTGIPPDLDGIAVKDLFGVVSVTLNLTSLISFPRGHWTSMDVWQL